MSLIYNYGINEQIIDLCKYVEITATNPAKIFGLYPQKGTLGVGSDADIIIFDPNLEKTISKDLLHERLIIHPIKEWR
ncbi:hypothetical protein N752_25645 [Desulforamulus aquiferis]|nr:amidohydrolase family protein [Desulforamulus aquiferis]RYD02339.1 hypothetical protein N752_25645 [Desulforamulus aquiferis]